MVPCKCADRESSAKKLARLQKYSNLGPLTRMTFASLLPEGRSKETGAREQFRAAYDQAVAFAQKPEGWLVFTGPSGCGKTHLAAAIANRCIENGTPAFYVTTPDLLDHLRASFSPSSEMPFDEFFEQVRNAPVLVLDDFGAQSATPWAKEKLDQLLDTATATGCQLSSFALRRSRSLRRGSAPASWIPSSAGSSRSGAGWQTYRSTNGRPDWNCRKR